LAKSQRRTLLEISINFNNKHYEKINGYSFPTKGILKKNKNPSSLPNMLRRAWGF